MQVNEHHNDYNQAKLSTTELSGDEVLFAASNIKTSPDLDAPLKLVKLCDCSTINIHSINHIQEHHLNHAQNATNISEACGKHA